MSMKKQILQEKVNEGLTQQELADYFGMTRTPIIYWLKKYNLKTDPKYKRRKKSRVWSISKEELQYIINNSVSLAEVIRKLGYNDGHLNSAIYNPLKERIKEDELDISHIPLGKDSCRNRSFIKDTKDTFLEKLKTRKNLSGQDKQKLINFNIIPHENCSLCGQSRQWNGNPLTLQVDHIDGNPKNNMPINLRFVCPNCHTQTETFCKQKIFLDKNKCEECGKEIHRKSKMCMTCSNIINAKKQVKKFNPSKEELYQLVCEDKLPFTKLGEIFNVSDNAVRKRCRHYGICPKKRILI